MSILQFYTVLIDTEKLITSSGFCDKIQLLHIEFAKFLLIAKVIDLILFSFDK
jgi:hypothetical protein